MNNEYLGLGDVLETILNKLGYTIEDMTLMDSLNGINLTKNKDLEIIYRIKNKFEYSIPKVNSNLVMDEIKERELSFEKFWNLYNKKTGRVKCFSKWRRLKQLDIDQIFLTLPNYIKNTPDIQYRKNPETYLNQRTWEDEIYTQKQENKIYNSFKF